MREPDIKGKVAKAWVVRPRADAPKDQQGTLSAYLINGPFHLAWHYWIMSVIHLRDIPGVKPATKTYPEAEYEMLIVSVDPDHQPDPDDSNTFHWLQPPDFVGQFHGMTDAQAVTMLEAFVRGICAGAASPDSDYRQYWKDQLQIAVAHAQGKHKQ